MLLADDDIQPRVSLTKTVQRSVVGEGWANQHNVITLTFELAIYLVNKELRLARVCRANDERVEWNVIRIHFDTAQILTVCS